MQNAAGAILGPMDSWLILRGTKTLHLRVERSDANGREIARWLADRLDAERVIYPGLPSHPTYGNAQRYLAGGSGGIITFGLHRGLEAGRALIDNVKLFSI